MKRLSPKMVGLLAYIRAGGRVIYMPTNGRYDAYYFRADTHKAVSATVEGLLDRGLIEFPSLMQDAQLTEAGRKDQP